MRSLVMARRIIAPLNAAQGQALASFIFPKEVKAFRN